MVLADRRKARRPYARTGLFALKARVKIRGLDAIDRRTAAGRALVEWRRELISDLGGEAQVSAQERAVAELAVRTKLYVDSIDAWLMEQPSLVLKRRRALLPVLVERQRLADSLGRLLGQLGLQRRARPLPSLADHIAAIENREAGSPSSRTLPRSPGSVEDRRRSDRAPRAWRSERSISKVADERESAPAWRSLLHRDTPQSRDGSDRRDTPRLSSGPIQLNRYASMSAGPIAGSLEP